MATYYWVADGTGSKTGYFSDANHWSLTSGGAGGAGVPTQTDDVIFNASSGASTDICYIIGDACRNITANATSTAIKLSITSMYIYGNVAIGASTSFDLAYGSITHYVSSGGTNTINYGGKTVYCYMAFYYDTYTGTAGTFSITAALTCPYTIEINGGTWTNTTFAINTTRVFISNDGVKPTIVNLGSATYTLTNLGDTLAIGNAPPSWETYLLAGGSPTINAGTSVISMGSATVASQINDQVTFLGGGKTYNRLNLSGAYAVMQGANTFAILTYTTPSTVLTAGNYQEAFFVLSANQTVTSNYSVSGNAAIQRLMVTSDIIGTARTITIPATRTSNYVDYRDITISGTALSGTSLGNAQGCTNITFTPAVIRYARNTGTNFSSTTTWATSSGGAAGASVPLPQDTIIFDGNSINVGADMINLGGNLQVTSAYLAAGWNVCFAPLNGSGVYYLYGTITLPTGMYGILVGNLPIVLCNRTSRNFELDKMYNSLTFMAPGATITLTTSLDGDTNYGYATLGLLGGTLNTNGQTVIAGQIATYSYTDVVASATSMTLNLSSSDIYLYDEAPSGAHSFMNLQSSNLTINAGTSTIHCLNLYTQQAYDYRNTFVTTGGNYNYTFYNVYFGGTSSTYFTAVRIYTTNRDILQSFNSIGIDPTYPCAVLISVSGSASLSGISTSNIECSAAGKGKPLIFANDEPPSGSTYYQGQLTLNNVSPITLDYVAFKNMSITSTETITAYGVVNLGNVSGNKLLFASPVAVAAFTTVGNYTITMPSNFAGSMAVIAIGSGGAGTRSATTAYGGAGGTAGGTSFASNLNVSAGQTLYLTVPAGASTSGSAGGQAWLNISSNNAPSAAQETYGVYANGGTAGGGSPASRSSTMISLLGGTGGSGLSGSGGGGGGGGGAVNSFNTTYTYTYLKGGTSSTSLAKGGAGGGGVTGAGANNTGSAGSAGGTGYGTAGGTAGGGAGSGGSGGGGGAYGSGAPGGVAGGDGGGSAGDIIAWFTNGTAGYTNCGGGGGGGGGGAATFTNAYGGNGGTGGIGAGGGGAGGSTTASRNGTQGSGGPGTIILMYSTYIPTVYATILGED